MRTTDLTNRSETLFSADKKQHNIFDLFAQPLILNGKNRDYDNIQGASRGGAHIKIRYVACVNSYRQANNIVNMLRGRIFYETKVIQKRKEQKFLSYRSY